MRQSCPVKLDDSTRRWRLPIDRQKVGILMMSSQLSRMILESTDASGDEMRAKPPADDQVDPIGGLLDDVAVQALSRQGRHGDRRPDSSTSTD